MTHSTYQIQRLSKTDYCIKNKNGELQKHVDKKNDNENGAPLAPHAYEWSRKMRTIYQLAILQTK